MGISVRVLPEWGLVYIRYSGRMSLDESNKAFAEYVAHPDFRPCQKQLVDLREVTDWERDFGKLMALQARKADAFVDPNCSTIVAAIASTETTRKVADFVGRSWDGIDSVAYLVAETEAHALDLLGLAAESLSELLDVR